MCRAMLPDVGGYGLTLVDMSRLKPPAYRLSATVRLGVDMPSELRKRFKLGAIEEGMCHAEFLDHLLDLRDDRLQRRFRSQRHPLERSPHTAVSS